MKKAIFKLTQLVLLIMQCTNHTFRWDLTLTLFKRRIHFDFFSRKYIVYEWSECKRCCAVREGEMSLVSKNGRGKSPRGKCPGGNVRHSIVGDTFDPAVVCWYERQRAAAGGSMLPDVRWGRSLCDGNAASHLMCIQCVFIYIYIYVYFFKYLLLSSVKTSRARCIR